MTEWYCCRTCLNTKSLNPIFQISNQSEKYSDILLIATGLKIEINDSLPQLICTDCVNFINQLLHFRNKCQTSYKQLLKRYQKKDFNDCKKELFKIDQTITIDINFNDSNDNKFDTLDDNNDSEVEKEENIVEFETEVQDILKKPIEIIFKNQKSHKKVKLNYADTEEVKRKSGVENEMETDIAMECKYCHKILKSKLSLHNHYKIHTGLNVVCEHCGKKFMNRRRLLMHCKAKHGYEKTDKCSYCDYRGCNAELVKIHERLHTGERPYVCQQCGAGFHRRSSYLQHVPIHLPEKTVQCDECPALFKSVTLMRIHKSRHAGRRCAHACAACGATFARRRDCARHAAGHAGGAGGEGATDHDTNKSFR